MTGAGGKFLNISLSISALIILENSISNAWKEMLSTQ